MHILNFNMHFFYINANTKLHLILKLSIYEENYVK